MQYIIFLRGINVNGRIIKMDPLKTCLEKAGYKKVTTLLQTGNILLECEIKDKNKLQLQIQSVLSKEFNYPAKAMVITPLHLKEIVDHYPFTQHETEFHRYVVFTEKGVERILTKEYGALDASVEEIRQGKGVVYWRVLKGHTTDSVFGKYMAKVSTKHVLTNRNLNTLEKILAKYQ